ncbi:phage tail assembly chaperone family protein, TAC [Klebsiella oxytoca]|uniref:Phage tail protein n=1 Tax=Klebsiella oxytoca TaxID=571 RepID=A0AAD3UPE4_KLEOX|nr:phage tail assembly chaperone family protein, TAC [Klebsiella oxytoca]MBL6088487.1 phage tail assembly chaperone family protein, TAC [Klebsiella oxytoca]MBL6253169.1 phage tail assembly chaperone family protein, TAC [Klebsiella oxytoca]MBL6274492.1 phage tail assembly chaperone family protein, TAC [Klebsiella oxytoca]MDU2890017.1 phage tail assembly chaperone family protein, TAC [Klebsiella oxytoca]MEC6026050.1 phage tail assembly chaperone family protein, TAC [Klebsiella oxytoca]
MKLTLDSLKKVGAFTGRPVEKEIEWKQGDEDYKATVFVRPPGYHVAMQGIQAAAGKVDGVAAYIAAAICDENGKPVFTPEDITGEADPELGPLDGPLTVALLVAIQEVNELGKVKSSAQKTNSGAN